ncbi:MULTISPECIES: hypothetical protein [Prochlorococcus]|uniref:hypothetical protein n=1 Tax=Prochlorococcus TaxID=1218 RepID=UPI0005339D25|nr:MULTISPECIES: hypothetical protein [Prochlorococcus]KGG11908.1 hypothetical protein EV05_1109 [Prochlorococcus sp. MIT 0601]
MKIRNSDLFNLANENLLGGAAMSIADLVKIQSQEIQWSSLGNKKDLFDEKEFSA